MHSQSSIPDIKKLMDNKQFHKAEQLLSTYLKSNANHVDAIELLGDSYSHQEKWDEAIIEYRKLVVSESNNANFHYKYGGALGMKALSVSKIKALGLIGDVKSAFLKSAELDPTHIDVRWALVELYMQLPGIIGGSKSKSLKYANELSALSPVDGYLAKGYIYEYDEDPELAEKYYKLAISEGGSVTCYEKLTDFYINDGQLGKAIRIIEESGELHKRNAIHYQIGKVCATYNIELDKGKRCLLKYIDDYSVKDGVPKAWAYYRLAQIFRYKDSKAEALVWIEKALYDLPDITVFKEERVAIQNL